VKKNASLLFLLLIACLACCGPCIAFAQLNLSAEVFDPNCYFPQVGTRGQIDTIYGAVPYPQLGASLKGIGPAPGDHYNRIVLQGFEPVTDSNLFFGGRSTDIFQGGKSFSLASMMPVARSNVPLYACKFAHLRSRLYLDAIFRGSVNGNVTIFWQDALGNYDLSHQTVLYRGGSKDQIIPFTDADPILGKFSHDSTDDIIQLWDSARYNVAFACWYDGQKLYGKDTAWADSTVYFDTLSQQTQSAVRLRITGNFCGTGRTCFLAGDWWHNAFMFRNEPPFTLGGFVHSMKYDTLWARADNPQLGTQGANGYLAGRSIPMQVFPKAKGDESEDLLTEWNDQTDLAHHTPLHIYCFKGGRSFGSHRLNFDSADYIFHTPIEFGNAPAFGRMQNVGDMTGTGNNVLMLVGFLDPGSPNWFLFYVTGRALDSKADMAYLIQPSGFMAADTLTADRDGLQDLMLGFPGYYSYDDLDSGKTAKGTIHILHGSKRIPVHLSPQFDVALGANALPATEVYPNPATKSVSVILRGSPGEYVLTLRDVLGREVLSKTSHVTQDGQIESLDVSTLNEGTFVLEVQGLKHFVTKIEIIR
jgi:hypothetical protein